MIVAELPVMFVEVTAEMVGATVSNVMVLVTALDQLPAGSSNSAYTVFTPSPVVSVQAAVVAYDWAVEKLVPVFENRICETVPELSVADKVSVEDLELVADAPPSITTEPVGAWLSTVTVTGVEIAVLPAASRARAESTCEPFEAVVVFQLIT